MVWFNETIIFQTSNLNIIREKRKKNKLRAMTDTVYKYMKVQNRPYSINDLVSNLHNEYGKTAVQKAIDKLVTEGKIFEKVGYLIPNVVIDQFS